MHKYVSIHEHSRVLTVKILNIQFLNSVLLNLKYISFFLIRKYFVNYTYKFKLIINIKKQ